MLSQIWDNGKALFAWKAHPARVLYLALPLAALALALSALEAILEWRIHRDQVYLIIWFSAVAILVVALAPVWREIYRELRKDAERPCVPSCECFSSSLLQQRLEEYAPVGKSQKSYGKYPEEDY